MRFLVAETGEVLPGEISDNLVRYLFLRGPEYRRYRRGSMGLSSAFHAYLVRSYGPRWVPQHAAFVEAFADLRAGVAATGKTAS